MAIAIKGYESTTGDKSLILSDGATTVLVRTDAVEIDAKAIVDKHARIIKENTAFIAAKLAAINNPIKPIDASKLPKQTGTMDGKDN